MITSFTLTGGVPSKKNSRKAIYVGGRTIMIANDKHVAWHKDASMQLIAQRAKKIPGEYHKVEIKLFAPDRRKGDLTNKAESIMDLLVNNGIIEDDNWFVVGGLHLFFGGVDKENPRAEVIIETIDSEEDYLCRECRINGPGDHMDHAYQTAHGMRKCKHNKYE